MNQRISQPDRADVAGQQRSTRLLPGQWHLMRRGLAAVLAAGLLSCNSTDTATPPTPNPTPTPGTASFTTRTVASNLNVPWEIVWGPDNFIWMTERNGRISRVNPDNGQQQPLLTVADNYQQGESGLLGMVLHPDFTAQPFVYAVYTYQAGGGIRERLVRYTYTSSALDSRQTLLENLPGNTFHDGSRLLITPDRHLLMTTGDAGNTALAQDPASLAGKVLRLNLDGSVPADNPFPGSYVWSLGHRNAQGLVLHPNGRLYASEHGPDSDDEINIVTRGGNYGWPTVRGPINASEETFARQNNVTGSILDWTPTIAPSDMVYYTSAAIPQFQNKLLVAVLKDKFLLAVTLSADGTAVTKQERFLVNQFGRLRDVCTSPDGRVFLATNGDAYNSQSGHALIEVKAGQ